MSWVLAIDFGTSVTAAATIELGASGRLRPIPVEVGGSWRVPSGVLRLPTGEVVVGGIAERQSALHIEAFEPTPKRRMGDAVMHLGGDVAVTDAIAALLAVMAGEARRSRGGTQPDAVCLTHPATWAGIRLGALREAAAAAGLTDVVLLPEPVAAACWYAATSGRVPEGGRVAVYDLGGGTFDAAVVESKGDGTFATVGRPGGVDPLGGVDFDFALLGLVGKTISERDQALWAALSSPSDTRARRRRRALLGQLRSLKEDLSTVAQSTLLVPETEMEVTVTRQEFAALIRPHIERSATVLWETIAAARTSAPELAAVYLVGGSSRIPMVEEVITERLGVTPTTLDEPKQVVAFGAVSHVAEQRTTGSPTPGSRTTETRRPKPVQASLVVGVSALVTVASQAFGEDVVPHVAQHTLVAQDGRSGEIRLTQTPEFNDITFQDEAARRDPLRYFRDLFRSGEHHFRRKNMWDFDYWRSAVVGARESAVFSQAGFRVTLDDQGRAGVLFCSPSHLLRIQGVGQPETDAVADAVASLRPQPLSMSRYTMTVPAPLPDSFTVTAERVWIWLEGARQHSRLSLWLSRDQALDEVSDHKAAVAGMPEGTMTSGAEQRSAQLFGCEGVAVSGYSRWGDARTSIATHIDGRCHTAIVDCRYGGRRSAFDHRSAYEQCADFVPHLSLGGATA